MRRSSSFKPLVVFAVGALIWLALGLAISNPYYRLMLTLVPIWAVFGISWNIFSGYSGLVSFGHAVFFGIGAFTVALGLRDFGLTPWLGIPLGAAIASVAGVLIGYATFRLRGSYFALAMLAYPLAFVAIFEWLGFQEVALPMRRDAPALYAQFSDYRIYIVLALSLAALATAISFWIERTRFGQSLLAIKQNELAAEAAGIDTQRWKMKALTLSAALAGAAGGLYAIVVLVVTPASVFGMVVSAQAMILVLFGGAGTLWGPLIGAIVLVVLGETLQAELGHIVPGIQGVVYGAAILLIILIAPEGVYWRIRDWLSPRRDKPAAAPVVEIVPEPADAARATTSPGPTLLSVRNVSKSYGGLKAVRDVSFDVPEGGIVGIIGPNGAGKTTLFNLLNGIVRPDGGDIVFAGTSITGRKPSEVCRRGIGRTFQVARAFPRMSVLENVIAGAFVAHDNDSDAWEGAAQAVAFVGLGDRADISAGTLTNRELRLMELARALAGKPRLVLLDEPLAGLGATETREMIALIRRLPSQGVTVAIIEHTMQAMISTVDSFVVLDHGAMLTSGAPETVMRDQRVIEAYLGRKWAQGHAAH